MRALSGIPFNPDSYAYRIRVETCLVWRLPVFGSKADQLAALGCGPRSPSSLSGGRVWLGSHRCVVEDRLVEGTPDPEVVAFSRRVRCLVRLSMGLQFRFGRQIARPEQGKESISCCRLGSWKIWHPPGDAVGRRCFVDVATGNCRQLIFPFRAVPVSIRVEQSGFNSLDQRPSRGAGASDWRTLRTRQLRIPVWRWRGGACPSHRGRDIPLLIQGETGSGKEWFAWAFHASGSRRNGPFVVVNCAAIPSGAHRAELLFVDDGAYTAQGVPELLARSARPMAERCFLDEIGDMPLFGLQAVLATGTETCSGSPGGGGVKRSDIALVCQPPALQSMVAKELSR